jgi:hypothetical protein
MARADAGRHGDIADTGLLVLWVPPAAVMMLYATAHRAGHIRAETGALG